METHGTYLLDTCVEKAGKKIGDMDMLIAATALHENLIVVTGYTDHFERIPGLKIENWME